METRLTADGTVVGRYGIIGTSLVIFAAFRAFPALSATCDHFSSVEGIGNTWLGRIGTERLPADLDALPAYSDERSLAVRRWQAENYARAYQAILEAYPEAFGGTMSMGEISMVVQ